MIFNYICGIPHPLSHLARFSEIAGWGWIVIFLRIFDISERIRYNITNALFFYN